MDVKYDKPSSGFLVACKDGEQSEMKRQLLLDVLSPVFFGEKRACTMEELEALFLDTYGIHVREDFCEGDDHYEEFLEAQQAIREGLSIYEGRIAFGDDVLADLAGTIWELFESQEGESFRRINTMLEE